MKKIIYRKNNYIISKEQAEVLLTAMDDFVHNSVIGQAQPRLDDDLMEIWNNGERLEWEWSEETEAEYNLRMKREEADEKELALFKSDNEAWKDAKIRPWRDQKLTEWIDETFIKPLFYIFSSEEENERILKRQELLDWPALPDFDSYKTDEEVDALKPKVPGWIKELDYFRSVPACSLCEKFPDL